MEQIVELWADVEAAFDESAPEYFLGTVVLTKQTGGARDAVIDGQQRLATISILLAAIRDAYAKRLDTKRADIVQREYLSKTDLQSAAEVSRLSLNSEDALFFQKRIVEMDGKTQATAKSHELLLAAYERLQQEIELVANEAGTKWSDRLSSLVAFLEESVKVIVLEVPSDADAYLIFETLNDRGADLTIADLLKNYLFGHAGAKLDAVRDGWMMVLGALEIPAETQIFTTFLRHYWSSIKGAVRERELYKSIKENVVSEMQVLQFINELGAAANLYSALLSSSNEYWDELGGTVRENVETLFRFELEQNRPLLLAALQHFTDHEKKLLLKSLVSWSVRGLVVGGIGGGTAEKAYCSAAVKIRSGAIKTTAELLVELSAIVPSDAEFKEAFESARVPKAGLARYYLAAMENHKVGAAEPEFVPNANEDKINLEHVLPKRASSADWSAFGPEERKVYVHRLGNMALLQKGPNGKIGNKSFAVKRPVLAASGYALTKELAAASVWTPAEIKSRQSVLADLAVKTWPQ